MEKYITGRAIEDGLELTEGVVRGIFKRYRTLLEPYTTRLTVKREGKARTI